MDWEKAESILNRFYYINLCDSGERQYAEASWCELITALGPWQEPPTSTSGAFQVSISREKGFRSPAHARTPRLFPCEDSLPMRFPIAGAFLPCPRKTQNLGRAPMGRARENLFHHQVGRGIYQPQSRLSEGIPIYHIYRPGKAIGIFPFLFFFYLSSTELM